MNDILVSCINEIANLSKEDKVNIKGKFYTTVATRVEIFRKHFGTNAEIRTEIVLNDLERVVVKATILVKHDGDWITIGSDFAEEFRNQGMVNKTSALENCCTSSIGRALAACGIGGSEYASSFEVDNAINSKQAAPDTSKGYNIKGLNGSVIKSCETPSIMLDALREAYEDKKTFKGIYAMNKAEIKKVQDSLPDDHEAKKGFADLSKAMEVSNG